MNIVGVDSHYTEIQLYITVKEVKVLCIVNRVLFKSWRTLSIFVERL